MSFLSKEVNSKRITSLTEREQHYRLLFDSMAETYQVIELIYDKNGRAIDYSYIDVNRAFEVEAGKKKKELIGKRVKDLFSTVEDFWIKMFERASKSDVPLEFGHYSMEMGKYYEGKAWKWKDNQVAVIFTDVTERKKAEEELRDSEMLYRTLFENTDDGFVIVQPIFDINGNSDDYVNLQINKAWEYQTGLKAANFEGKSIREAMPNVEPFWPKTYADVVRTGKSKRFENYNQASSRWYDVYAFPYKKGQVGVLFRDITEKKNLEKQLHEKERFAAIGQTAGMVGHDIRNPLQAMIGDVFLIKDELARTECKANQGITESLDGIEKNIEYINKIVLDLQDYARPIQPELQCTYLDELIAEVFEAVIIPDNIEISIDVEDKLRLPIDQTLLKRILSNLVLNAVQAMPKGGKLCFSACQYERTVLIIIEDTGIGIPEEIKPNLFKPLFTTKSKGQGLGLAVVKRLIEALNGTISFESIENKGTTFVVELPIKM